MSDLSMYELDDIIWDDLDRSDDHMVPRPSSDRGSGDSYEEDNCKKPWHEVTPVQSNCGNLYFSNTSCQEREERNSKALNKKRKMLEKDSCSQTHDVLAGSCDSDTVKDDTVIESCFKSSNDRILNDTSAAADRNSYHYPLSHIRQTDDLSFFDNGSEDKEASDLLYYGWPDMGNFEDVDRMLRTCDSSFGLGVTGNDDELVWFTSEDPIGGSEEALKMDFKFSCSEPCALADLSHNNEPTESNDKMRSCISVSKDELKLRDQVVDSNGVVQLKNKKRTHLKKDDGMKKQPKRQNQPERKKADQCLGNDGSVYHMCDLKSNDISLSSIDEFDQASIGSSMMTGIRSANKGDPSFQATAAEVDEQKTVNYSHEFPPSFTGNQRQLGLRLQDSMQDLFSAQKQVSMLENKLESRGGLGEKKGASAESSPNVPENSSTSYELDEVSLEATTFHQLQQIMEHLDLRTKLCIRDSLHRLARSAEERHNYASLSGSAADGDTGAPVPLMTEGTNKCAEFMDMETETNPIDRSVAHLLFHRPSDSSNLPAPFSLHQNAMIHGSITSQHMVPEKLVIQEEAAK